MANDEPRDLFGPVPPKPVRARPPRSSPPVAVPPARPQSYLVYLMDWTPLRWLGITTIVLVVGLVYGTQIDLFFDRMFCRKSCT